MNYKNFNLSKKTAIKALFSLIVVAGFFLVGTTLFYPKQSLSTLPSCTTLTAGTANPGVNCTYPSCTSLSSGVNAGVNCLPSCSELTDSTSTTGSSNPIPGKNCYYLNLPLCTATSNSVSIFSNTGTSPIPRSNCADLVDMPLCSQMNGMTTAVNQKNCVNECSPALLADTGITGHNVDCVRFCDQMPSGMTPSPRTNSSIGNCVYRQCHQLDNGTLPTNSNCSLTTCNLLTPDELDESRMQNDSDPNFAKYCDGSSIKCYNFTAAQLPFVRYRYTNTMCQIHKCKPASVNCGRIDSCTGFTLGSSTTDDTLNISCNTSSLQLSDGTSKSFSDLYVSYVNVGLSLSDTSFCTPVTCKPTVYTPYPCTADDAGNKTIANPNCDISGDGATCATSSCTDGAECRKDLGYCYKTVDCNIAANASTSACLTSSSPDAGEAASYSDTDDTNSSFMRPVPLNKSYDDNNPSQGFRTNDSCYGMGDLKNQSDDSSDDHKWGYTPVIDMSWLFGNHSHDINLGYYHMQWGPNDRTRSPGSCTAPYNGGRGPGYIYLCGNKGNLYQPISEKSAYYKGYVNTTFLEDKDSISTIKVCLRFKNILRTEDSTMSDSETCGSRECAISYFMGQPLGQFCGYDYCKSLTVQYSNSKQCAMDNDLFLNNDDDRPCAEVIDSFLRLRAVQYGHLICAFVDVKGTFAYNKMYFDSNQKLDNGLTCVSGTYNSTTQKCDGGKNTNDDDSLADRWRTILKVRYTSGNTTRNNVSGFYDKNGKFVKAQECVKVPITTSPPDSYNLATSQNSIKLFSPPLYIRSVNNERGGTSVIGGTGSSLGTTDFLYPEIVAQFGTTTKTLSMGPGYSGYEVNKDPLSYAMDSDAVTTVMNGTTYSANLLIKKEVDQNTNQPIVCLYQRMISNSGYTDIKVACVNRTFPQINNIGTTEASILGIRKVSISGTLDGTNTLNIATNTYRNATINLKYCSDISCSNTNTLNLTNTDPTTPTCGGVTDNNLEKYKICAKREICSMLWKECMENEIAIQNNAGILTSTTSALRTKCQSIADGCNARKGITSPALSLIDQANADLGDPNAYGWFNEICIVSGFDTRLGKVYGAITNSSGVAGKCLTSESRIACPYGGDGINCHCVDASSRTAIDGYIIRDQTPHEAGLCVQIPKPKICSAINYGGDSYNTSSLNGTSYTNDGGIVNVQHRNRLNSVISGISSNAGHAEFPTAVVGMNNISGTCNGFWQTSSVNGSLVTPKMNCVDDLTSTVSGNWSGVSSTINSASCTRFYCSAISTGTNSNDANASGIYTNPIFSAYTEIADSINETPAAPGNSYGITYAAVTVGNKGAINGYAIWPQFTKTTSSDFLESYSASSCIAGYTASTLPTRSCNQLGNIGSVASSCQRRYCSAVLPPINPGSDLTKWAQWFDSKGATFGVQVYLNTNGGENYVGQPVGSSPATYSTPASLSTSSATPGTTRKGYCNNALGFYSPSGSSQPERDCLYNGTWGPVRNPCVSSCSPETANNATWAAVNNVPIGESVTVTGTCLSGYSPYPYSRTIDDNGNAISPVPDPNTVTPESAPHRSCQSTIVSGSVAQKWTTPSSKCVNQCPGYYDDPREGVGKTTHNTAQYGSIFIKWDPASAGTTQTQITGFYSNNTSLPSPGNPYIANYFSSGRTNGSFIVTRYCNSNYKWSNPIVQCAAGGGSLNNAILGTDMSNPASITTNPTSSNLLSVFVASGSTITANSCASGYGSSSMPSFKCQAGSGNIDAYGLNYLDQYFFNKTSGNDCNRITCSLAANSNQGSGSYYSGATTTLDTTTTVTLSCRSGYGYAIVGGNSGGDNTCGRNATDRLAQAPTAKCVNSSGVGTLQITNDCSACRGCDSSSPFDLGNRRFDNSLNNNYPNTVSCIGNASGSNNHCYYLRSSEAGCNNGSYTKIATPTIPNLSNGSTIYFCRRVGNDADSSGGFGLKCLDGRILVNVACSSGSGYCTDSYQYSTYWKSSIDFPSPNNSNWFPTIQF